MLSWASCDLWVYMSGAQWKRETWIASWSRQERVMYHWLRAWEPIHWRTDYRIVVVVVCCVVSLSWSHCHAVSFWNFSASARTQLLLLFWESALRRVQNQRVSGSSCCWHWICTWGLSVVWSSRSTWACVAAAVGSWAGRVFFADMACCVFWGVSELTWLYLQGCRVVMWRNFRYRWSLYCSCCPCLFPRRLQRTQKKKDLFSIWSNLIVYRHFVYFLFHWSFISNNWSCSFNFWLDSFYQGNI